jgi:uncharacterized protein YbaR (Trm112 family)
MTSEEFLAILRCPMDPAREARLEAAPDGLICRRCGVKYPHKGGLPSLMVDEAVLPPGCPSPEELPCRKAPQPAPEVPA